MGGIKEDTGFIMLEASNKIMKGLDIPRRDRDFKDEPFAVVSFKPGCVTFAGIGPDGESFPMSWKGKDALDNLQEGVGVTTFIRDGEGNLVETHLWIHLDENGIGIGVYPEDCTPENQIEWNNFHDIGTSSRDNPVKNGHKVGNTYIGLSKIEGVLKQHSEMVELDGVELPEGVQLAAADAPAAALPQEVVTAALEAAKDQANQVG